MIKDFLVGFLKNFRFVAGFLKDGILMPPAPGLTRQFHVKIELQEWMAVQTFIIGTVTSFVATFLASLRVINQKISDLLRSV